jgi:hypothetical protein
MQTAFEAAVAQAVADGVITQEQADQLLSEDGLRFFGDPGMHPGMRGGHHHGGPGGANRGFGFPGRWLDRLPLPPENGTPDAGDSTNEPPTDANL